MSRSRADRSGRTGDERHHRELRFLVCFGLMIDAALVSMIAKDPRRKLATRIAIDAGGVDEEIPLDIFR